jgi:hypothetical protein
MSVSSILNLLNRNDVASKFMKGVAIRQNRHWYVVKLDGNN